LTYNIGLYLYSIPTAFRLDHRIAPKPGIHGLIRIDKNGSRLQSDRSLVAAAAAAEQQTPLRAQAPSQEPARTAPDRRQGPVRCRDSAADQAAVGVKSREPERHVSLDAASLCRSDRRQAGTGRTLAGTSDDAALSAERHAWAGVAVLPPGRFAAPPPGGSRPRDAWAVISAGGRRGGRFRRAALETRQNNWPRGGAPGPIAISTREGIGDSGKRAPTVDNIGALLRTVGSLSDQQRANSQRSLARQR
jgi:hypothetical protein